MLLLGQPPGGAAALAVFAFAMYVPSGYYIDKFVYNRRQKQKQKAEAAVASRLMDVRMFTVGPVMENCFLFRRDGSDKRADRRSR